MTLWTIKYYPAFRRAIPEFEEGYLYITHPFATTSQLNRLSAYASSFKRRKIVRLAYLRHTANIHPEPWSNSHWNTKTHVRRRKHGFIWVIDHSKNHTQVFEKNLLKNKGYFPTTLQFSKSFTSFVAVSKSASERDIIYTLSPHTSTLYSKSLNLLGIR